MAGYCFPHLQNDRSHVCLNGLTTGLTICTKKKWKINSSALPISNYGWHNAGNLEIKDFIC